MIEEEDMLFKLYAKIKMFVESDLGWFVASSVAYSPTRRIFGYPSRHGTICVCGGPSNHTRSCDIPIAFVFRGVKNPSKY